MAVHHQEIARCLFRESNDALFIFDPADHRVLDVNPAALRLTGLDRGVACSLRLRDLFSSARSGGLEGLIDAYRRTGFYHSREGYFLARESGPPIPVNVSVSRIHTEPEPMGLVVARDISERIRSQESLRESEARYRGLVESIGVVVFTLDSEGRFTSLNPAFESVTGQPRDAWIGRPYADLLHPDDIPVADEAFRRALDGTSPPPFEVRARSLGSEERILEVLSANRQDAGGQPLVTGVARDNTERKRAREALRDAEEMRLAKEAAEAADRAKSEFLGNISHEIRTPMTAILGFTDMLLDDPRVGVLPPDLLDGLQTIRHNGNHLLALLNDILDLTRIEIGRLRIDRRPISLAELVEEVADSMRPRAEARNIALDVEFLGEPPATITTDPVRLRQVLINLLSNAIKFTPKGCVRLQVRLDPGPVGGATLRLAVIDTGVGMSEPELGHLFEPFFTSDAHSGREVGAGLGLAISRRLAEMLGGRIEVQSRLGQGSTFTLILPTDAGAGRPDAAARAPSEAGTPAPAGPSHLGGRILLAEDNDSIRRFIALRLEQVGTEVVTARNGEEAVDLALAAVDVGCPFDWILMDVQMPVLDGYEATRRLRGLGYRRPIIALTAYAFEEDRQECLRFGCDDHLSKPIDWGRLVAVLNAHRGPAREPGPAPAEPASS